MKAVLKSATFLYCIHSSIYHISDLRIWRFIPYHFWHFIKSFSLQNLMIWTSNYTKLCASIVAKFVCVCAHLQCMVLAWFRLSLFQNSYIFRSPVSIESILTSVLRNIFGFDTQSTYSNSFLGIHWPNIRTKGPAQRQLNFAFAISIAKGSL